jgi:hypothetical protein
MCVPGTNITGLHTCTPAHLHTCTPAHLHTCTVWYGVFTEIATFQQLSQQLRDAFDKNHSKASDLAACLAGRALTAALSEAWQETLAAPNAPPGLHTPIDEIDALARQLAELGV